MYRLLVLLLLPYVSRWIAAQERRILAGGVPLSEQGLHDARCLGVTCPEKVRLLKVPVVPLPGGRWIAMIGSWAGMPGGNTAGLTAGYGIFICETLWGDRRLVVHELAHTAQYERLGGIRPFLQQYLTQCLASGYSGAAMELEATAAAANLPS